MCLKYWYEICIKKQNLKIKPIKKETIKGTWIGLKDILTLPLKK